MEPSKTRVVNVNDGFDFLGFNVKRYIVGRTSKLLIKPSNESINRAREKIRSIISECKGNNVEMLIKRLNPVIIGIGNYWKPMVSKRAFSTIDNDIFYDTYQFLRHLHPKKPMKWLTKRYYPYLATGEANRWTLISPENKIVLKRMSTIHIERHVVIRHNSSPFDDSLKGYFEERGNRISRSHSQTFYYLPLFLGQMYA